ncbi:Hypothetical protein CINCED_3A011613, partial [Cinara cedri]
FNKLHDNDFSPGGAVGRYDCDLRDVCKLKIIDRSICSSTFYGGVIVTSFLIGLHVPTEFSQLPCSCSDNGSGMDQLRVKSVMYATLAGICGSSAGIFGKIGMGLDGYFGDSPLSFINLGRFIAIVMVILANIGVWLMYTKSLQFGPTIGITGISIAANYIFTALTGVVLFGESCSFLWACGTLSVMVGVILMSTV